MLFALKFAECVISCHLKEHFISLLSSQNFNSENIFSNIKSSLCIHVLCTSKGGIKSLKSYILHLNLTVLIPGKISNTKIHSIHFLRYLRKLSSENETALLMQ